MLSALVHFLTEHSQLILKLGRHIARRAQITPPRRFNMKLFRIQLSDLHVPEEDSKKPWCNQFESKFLEAKYFTDEDSVLCLLMSPVLFTRRRRRPFGYLNYGNLRGTRTELGWERLAGTWTNSFIAFDRACHRSSSQN
jgi:hypothetical protein